jgi:hypothetical protein
MFYNFIIFDNKLPLYTLYNFNYEQYNIDYNLNYECKYDIFTHFWNKQYFTYDKPYVINEEFKKYFLEINDIIIDYINSYGFIHNFFLSKTNLSTYIKEKDLIIKQFNIINYKNKEYRRLQNFYNDYGIYCKYNFDFEKYSNDFNIYGSKLLLFSDFIIRNNYLKNENYKNNYNYICDIFKKYFIITDKNILTKYIINYGVMSVLNNINNNFYNIDFEKYNNLSIKEAKDHYLKYGQFELLNISFKLNLYEVNNLEGFFYNYDDKYLYVFNIDPNLKKLELKNHKIYITANYKYFNNNQYILKKFKCLIIDIEKNEDYNIIKAKYDFTLNDIKSLENNIFIEDNLFDINIIENIKNITNCLELKYFINSDIYNNLYDKDYIILEKDDYNELYKMIYENDKLKKYIKENFNKELNYPSYPIEYRLYKTGYKGMYWHQDKEILNKKYLECILVLHNDSNSHFTPLKI